MALEPRFDAKSRCRGNGCGTPGMGQIGATIGGEPWEVMRIEATPNRRSAGFSGSSFW
jgi:hypothetical protein